MISTNISALTLDGNGHRCDLEGHWLVGTGLDGGTFREIGNRQARAGKLCIIEWTARRQERYLGGTILGVVSHVIIPEAGIGREVA
ncbi:MAG TPA: hypothetical protein VI756_19995 [Blastocatellia bacterium]